MDALLQLVASALKAGFHFQAAATLTKIGQKAENDFGWDDERTIWAKISIGTMSQRHRSWESAKPWFESARAASFAANGEEDGLTRSLQKAMGKRYFSDPWDIQMLPWNRRIYYINGWLKREKAGNPIWPPILTSNSNIQFQHAGAKSQHLPTNRDALIQTS